MSIQLFCLSLLLPHFTSFFPFIIFILNFVFSLAIQLVSILHSYCFSPVQPLKANFLVNGHLSSFSLLLKYLRSLSTISNL